MPWIKKAKSHTTCWKPSPTISRVGNVWECNGCGKRYMVVLGLNTSRGQTAQWRELGA